MDYNTLYIENKKLSKLNKNRGVNSGSPEV